MDGLFDSVILDTVIRTAWTQCWQVTLLIAGVWLTVRCTARNRPHLASILWLVVLIKCVTPPLWSSPSGVFSWLQQPAAATPDELSPHDTAHILNLVPRQTSDANGGVVVKIDRSQSPTQPAALDLTLDETQSGHSVGKSRVISLLTWSGLIAVTWLLGCVAFACLASVRGLLCWRRLHRSGYVDQSAVTQLAANLSQRLGLRRPVRVLVSRSPVGPAVIGFWRPTVILPALIVEAKTLAELELLLAHEIIHVRRGDLWVGLLQLVSMGIWWFHPLVRYVNRLVTREAERCCDEAVIAYLGCQPAQYARSLIDVLALKRTLKPVPIFPGVRPVDVTSQRLERIMKLGQGCRKQTPHWYWLILFVAVSVTLPGAAFIAAQEKPTPQPNPLGPVPLAIDLAFPIASDEPQTRTNSTRANVVIQTYEAGDLLKRAQQDLQDLSATESDAQQLIIDRLKHAMMPTSEGPELVVDMPPAKVTPISSKTSGPSLIWRGEFLVITATLDEHAKMREPFALMRKNGFEQLQIETRVITGPAAAIDQIAAQWSGLGQPAPAPAQNHPVPENGESKRAQGNAKIQGSAQTTIEKHVPIACAVIDATMLQAIIDQGQSDARTSILFAPKVTVFNGQQATIEDSITRPFIVGHQPADKGMSPVIRLLKEGWFLSLMPKKLDQDLVSLNMTLQQSKINRIETALLPAVDKQPALTVQIPEQSVTKIQTLVELKPGQSLLIGGLKMDVPGANAHGKAINGNLAQPSLIIVTVRKVTAVVASPAPPTPARSGHSDQADSNQSRRKSAPPINPEIEPLKVRVYSVADLVIPVPDARLNRSPKRDPGPALDRKADFAPLEDLIVTTIAPESWDRNGGSGSIKRFESTLSLVVRQTPTVHKELQGLLGQIRTLQDLQVSFAVEPINLSQADFKAWLDRADGPAKQKLKSKNGSLAIALTGPDAKSLRRISNGENSVPVLKITLMNGQQGELQVKLDDAPAEGHIAWLQLLPSIMPELQRVRVNVSAGLSDHPERLDKKSELVTLNHDESLLVDIAADSWLAVDASRSVPVLENIPYLGQMFKIGTTDPKPLPTHRRFYLLTPKVLLVRDAVQDAVPPSQGR
ncbi:MAG: hypothetical protein JWM11_6958 [Planctomycetaceae bacterium]|nr:hypothetical protein [Planctomycetaceae bacterium]